MTSSYPTQDSASLIIDKLHAGYQEDSNVYLPHLTLHRGERCLISGPSGVGKTTLISTIAGIKKPLGGSVKLNGTDIYTLSEGQRDAFRGTHIGIVFQTLHLVKSLSVIDNLMLAPYLTSRHQDRSLALDLLNKLGISDLANRPATSISQGQAQRVAIARALWGDPKLLLADEPTSSLDDESCAKTLDLLVKLSEEAGAILIVSSHDSRILSYFQHHITLGTVA